jgi:hypothetical protein
MPAASGLRTTSETAGSRRGRPTGRGGGLALAGGSWGVCAWAWTGERFRCRIVSATLSMYVRGQIST